MYQVEVFNEHGLKLGYAYCGRLKKYPVPYPHPSNARRGAEAFIRHNPDCHCFVNEFTRIPVAKEYVQA